MDMTLLGAGTATIERGGESPDYTNYYFPQCPGGVRTVRSYASLTYKNVYPAIDLVYHQTPQGVKYDFVVNPGGNVEDIRMRYDGATGLTRTSAGTVLATNPYGGIEEAAPYSYQAPTSVTPELLEAPVAHDGAARTIAVSFRLRDNVLSFAVGAYDRSIPLVIDPTLAWCTYFGGTYGENGIGICTDRSGNIICTGTTSSPDFPATIGAFQTAFSGGTFDVFVAKLTDAGARLWATYYGGKAQDAPSGVATDSKNNIFVTGGTSSPDFPVSTTAFQSVYGNDDDAFLIKFDSNGTREWATFVGDSIGGIAVTGCVATDGNGNAFITGSTFSTSFPITSGAFQTAYAGAYGTNGNTGDAFLEKFDGNGNLLWGTYYGGSSFDYGNAIATDAHGSVFMTGYTGSTDFPVTAGAFQGTFGGGGQDAFIVKFDSAGTRQWATFLGGSGDDAGFGAAADANGNVFVSGFTASSNFPVSSGAFQTFYAGSEDAFLAKFDGTGSRLWCTYYGGTGLDNGVGVATDTGGNVLMTGYTSSGASFPTTANAYQSNIAGYFAFIAAFNGNGSRTWATQFGAPDGKYTTEGYDVTTDAFANMLLIGATSAPDTDFPITPDAFLDNSIGKHQDAYIAKFCDDAPVYANGIKTDTICPFDSATIGNGVVRAGTPPYIYRWTPATGVSDSTAPAPKASPDTTTMYYIFISDAHGCGTYDSTRVVVRHMSFTLKPADTICKGTSLRLAVSVAGGKPPYTYAWSPATGLDSAAILSPLATPMSDTRYTLTVSDANGCRYTGVVAIHVRPQPASFPGLNHTICEGDTVRLAALPATGGIPPYTYAWSPTAGLSAANVLTPMAFPKTTTNYYLTVTNSEGCSDVDSVRITVNPAVLLNAGDTTNQTICPGDTVTIGGVPAGGNSPFIYKWNPPTGLSNDAIAAPLAAPDSTTTYAVVITDSAGCQAHGLLTVTVRNKKPGITASGPTTLLLR